MIHIMLCDDHLIVLEGIAEVISRFENCKICAHANSGEEALSIIKKGTIPDILILDISMPPGISGIEVAKSLQINYPEIYIIGFSMFVHLKTIATLIKYGAKGFLSKGCKPKELENAIRQIYSGNYCFESLFPDEPNWGFTNKIKEHATLDLSKRELEVAKLMSTDKAYKEIASDLKISPNTIENIRVRIFEKTESKTRTEAVLSLISMGLININ